jgi:hypothetical protein
MKILVENYTFNAASGEITFTDYNSVNLESMLLVTNVTDNIIIYNFADVTRGGTVSGNVLNLGFDTSSMSDSDSLQIFIEDGYISAKDQTLQDLLNSIDANSAILRKLLLMSQSLGIIDSSSRQRVVVDSIAGNLPGNQNVNINTVGGFGLSEQFINETRRTFANGTRANIINT